MRKDRDILYQYLLNDVEDNVNYAQQVLNILKLNYPNNIEKQKDLLCALFETFKGFTSNKASIQLLFESFKKYNVTEVIWKNILSIIETIR